MPAQAATGEDDWPREPKYFITTRIPALWEQPLSLSSMTLHSINILESDYTEQRNVSVSA